MVLMNDKIDNIEYERVAFEGKIHLIDSDELMAKFAHECPKFTRLGFDTETRPSFKKGDNYKMALIQLSSDTDAYLFRLHYLTNFLPIKKLLEDKDIVKIGLAIRDDIKGIQKMFPFTPHNFIELQDLAKTKGLKNFGLKGMTEEVLDKTLSKKAKLTNWEQKSLTTEQMKYAATDAWIALKIYEKLD